MLNNYINKHFVQYCVANRYISFKGRSAILRRIAYQYLALYLVQRCFWNKLICDSGS